MVQFYQLDAFKGFDKTPLFIFGESYAGHYIPSVSKGILEHNAKSNVFEIPLKGIGIGDGWTDPVNQLHNYDLYAFSLGLVDYVGRTHAQV